MPKDQFFQFSWRPRAPSLLSKEAEADIARRLKEFSKRYDEEDSDILKQAWSPLLSCLLLVILDTNCVCMVGCGVPPDASLLRGLGTPTQQLSRVTLQRHVSLQRCCCCMVILGCLQSRRPELQGCYTSTSLPIYCW